MVALEEEEMERESILYHQYVDKKRAEFNTKKLTQAEIRARQEQQLITKYEKELSN